MNAGTCRACGASILWIKMKVSGKMMPVDAEPKTYEEPDPSAMLIGSDGSAKRGAEAGDLGYISHFATCPKAQQFRKPKTEGDSHVQS